MAGRLGTVPGMVFGLIFVAAGWIIFEAVQKLMNPEPLGTLGWGVGVMTVSVVLNYFV